MTAPAIVRRRVERPSGTIGSPASRRPGPASEPRFRDGAASRGEGGRCSAAALRAARRIATTTVLPAIRRAALPGAALVTVVAAHAGLAPHLAVRGAGPDLLLVTVAAVALVSGARAGAAFGFAAGLGADLFLSTPLGTAALAYTLVGHTLGGASRVGPAAGRGAASLCGLDSTCFACRSGRRHAAEPAAAVVTSSDAADAERRPGLQRPLRRSTGRRARRVAARRAAQRRAVVLTFVAVAGGHLAAAAVGTSLGGVPFPAPAVLLRMAGTAALSAPFAPLAVLAVRRLARPSAAPASVGDGAARARSVAT